MDPRFTDLLLPLLKFTGDTGIDPDSSLRDLGLDSMASVELLFAVEDTFDITLPEEALSNHTFATAGSLWTAVEQAVADQHPTSGSE